VKSFVKNMFVLMATTAGKKENLTAFKCMIRNCNN